MTRRRFKITDVRPLLHNNGFTLNTNSGSTSFVFFSSINPQHSEKVARYANWKLKKMLSKAVWSQLLSETAWELDSLKELLIGRYVTGVVKEQEHDGQRYNTIEPY